MNKNRISIAVPGIGVSTNFRGAKLTVIDEDGETVVEGSVALEIVKGQTSVFMSSEIAEEMISTFLEKNGVTVDAVRKAIDMLSERIEDDRPSKEDISIDSMKSIIVNKLTADEEETVRGDVRKFVENVNSARPQDRQAYYDAWQYYLSGLYSTQREIAISECDKIVAELIKSGKYYKNMEIRVFREDLLREPEFPEVSPFNFLTTYSDEARKNILGNVRRLASNVFTAAPEFRKVAELDWTQYLSSLMVEWHNFAISEYCKEMTELVDNAAAELKGEDNGN